MNERKGTRKEREMKGEEESQELKEREGEERGRREREEARRRRCGDRDAFSGMECESNA